MEKKKPEKDGAKKKLSGLGSDVVSQLSKEKNPDILLPIRTLSNIFFDEKTGLVRLGDKVSHRTYLNVAHTRKFMQTLLIAAECKKIIEQGVTTSIRDLYYAIKHTIPETKENTVEDQSESLCPDEPVLIKLGDETQIVPAREVVEYAYEHGEVFENNGKTRITNVPIYTYAFDENLNIKEHKVKAVLKHKSKEAVEITTSSGRKVKITPYHSLFTLDRNGNVTDVKVSDLRKGDHIALPGRIRVNPNKKPINIVEKLIQRAPEDVLRKVYLKGNRKTIDSIISSIDKEELKAFVKKRYKTRWSDAVYNWKRGCSIPILLVKHFKSLYKFIPKLKIGGWGGRHHYPSIIKRDYNLGLLLGYLLSEGSHYIHEKRKGERFVSISNKSKIFISQFLKAFEAVFKDTCATKTPVLGKDGVYKINIGYDVFSYILEYALSYKPVHSWKKEVPGFLFDAPGPCIRGFLKGFREGDGSCFRQKPRIRYHTSSPDLVNGLTFLMLRLGVFPRIYCYPKRKPHHHDRYELRTGTREDLKKMSHVTKDFGDDELERKSTISSDKIPNIGELIHRARKSCKFPAKVYKQVDFYGVEKKKAISKVTLNKVINLLELHNAKQTDVSILKSLADCDIFWDSIVSIRKAKKPEYTIDLAVNPTQNFIGGHGLIILHNSDPILEDLEATLNTLREKLHLQADRKGYVAGPLVVLDSGDTIDCSKMGSSGWAIPSNVEPEVITFKKCTADFVLCMPPSEKIFIFMDGKPKLVKISELSRLKNKNLEVLSYDKNYKTRKNKIAAIHSRKSKPNEKTVKITSRSGSVIKVTGEHKIPVLTENGIKMVPAKDIKPGDFLLECKNMPSEISHPDKIDMIELLSKSGEKENIRVTGNVSDLIDENTAERLGLYITKKFGSKKYRCPYRCLTYGWKQRDSMPLKHYLQLEKGTEREKLRVFFTGANKKDAIRAVISLDNKFARLLGYYLAEGHVHRNCVGLSFGSHEKEYHEEACKLVNDIFGIKPVIYRHGNDTQIFIQNKGVRHLFNSLNSGTRALNKKIPDFVYGMPSDFIQNMLQTYLNGDGYKDKTEYKVATISQDLNAGVNLLFRRIGIPTYRRKIKNRGFEGYKSKPLFYTDIPRGYLEKINKKSQYLWDKYPLFLVKKERKNKKFSPYFANNYKTINKSRLIFSTSKEVRKWLDADIHPVMVRKVEHRKYKGRLYDIAAVVPSHIFMHGSGIFVHNCIEKDAIWQRLNQDKFWKKQNCLILTGKGQPARGCRRLINRLHKELKLPVYVIADGDPWGAYIYSVIKQGSINLSFLSDRLGTPAAKYIGLTTKDVEKFGIPKNVTIKLNEGDKKRINEMLNYVWFKPKEWQEELKNMLKVGYKLELEALSAKGIKFISEKYLPEKIGNKDFLS